MLSLRNTTRRVPVLSCVARMPTKGTTARRGRGRPPAGPYGEHVRDYRHQFGTRTRGDLFHLISAIKTVTGVNARYMLNHAINLYLTHRVNDEDRRAIVKLTKSAQAECADCTAETSPRRAH